MKQFCNLLCAAVLAASCLASARADVTVWVRAANAPHVYAWDSDGNKLLGEFPGTTLTAQDDVPGWWLCLLPGVSSASIIINNGGEGLGNQTGDNCHSCAFNKLDVSANAKLSNFRCYANKLTEILLPPSPNDISWFVADNNKLTSAGLDMTRLENVVVWRISYNPLGSVDLSNKPKLQSLGVIKCDLSELNLTGCPGLRSLYCRGNALTELNLTVVPELEGLTCSSNQLAELDLSSNTKLVGLVCDDNHLVGLDLSGLKLTANATVQTIVYGDYFTAYEVAVHDMYDADGNRTGLWYPDQERTIEAETGFIQAADGSVEPFYYLRLCGEEATDSEVPLEDKLAAGNPSGNKTFLLDRINNWGSGISGFIEGSLLPGGVTATAVDINPEAIVGTIMVLEPSQETDELAEGTFTYTYDVKADALNGATDMQSEFAIHWIASPKVSTGVGRLPIDATGGNVLFCNPAGQVSTKPWAGVNIVVRHLPDGTAASSKELH